MKVIPSASVLGQRLSRGAEFEPNETWITAGVKRYHICIAQASPSPCERRPCIIYHVPLHSRLLYLPTFHLNSTFCVLHKFALYTCLRVDSVECTA